MKKIKINAVIIALLAVINVGFVFLSQYCFLNSNIYKSVFSLAEVKLSDDKIVKLSGNSDERAVYIADTSISVDEFLTDMRYEKIEDKRLGSKYFVSKDNKEYSVTVRATRFYTVFLVKLSE